MNYRSCTTWRLLHFCPIVQCSSSHSTPLLTHILNPRASDVRPPHTSLCTHTCVPFSRQPPLAPIHGLPHTLHPIPSPHPPMTSITLRKASPPVAFQGAARIKGDQIHSHEDFLRASRYLSPVLTMTSIYFFYLLVEGQKNRHMFLVSMAEKCDPILKRRETYNYHNRDEQHTLIVKLSQPHKLNNGFILVRFQLILRPPRDAAITVNTHRKLFFPVVGKAG